MNRQVKLPEGYSLDWAGEYESAKRANKRLSVIVPITVLLIYLAALLGVPLVQVGFVGVADGRARAGGRAVRALASLPTVA